MVAMMELPIFATKLIYTVMTDYEYILKQARKFHYSKWTDSIGINVPPVSETNVPLIAERNVPLVSD